MIKLLEFIDENISSIHTKVAAPATTESVLEKILAFCLKYLSGIGIETVICVLFQHNNQKTLNEYKWKQIYIRYDIQIKFETALKAPTHR